MIRPLCALAMLSTAPAAEPLRTQAGVVVCAHPDAAQAGAAVLRSGGNAVDAAIATGMALAVVHPAAGNIGGGGFMIVRMASGEAAAFDFRETAPSAATPDMYLGPEGTLIEGSNHHGFRSVGVPGTVAGFDLARKRFGTLTWADCCRDAIRLAREGIPLTVAMAGEFAGLAEEWKKNPAAAAIFLKPGGTPYKAGEIWKQPDLAETLQRIATQGRDGFYRGETARLIAADMKAHGGLITEADLAAYQARERKPVRGTYRGCELISMAPPSSGGTALLQMLNILEGFDLKALGHNSPAYLHLLAEAMRRAYADRARFLGDPDFNPDIPAFLLAKDYAAKLRGTISPSQAGKSDPRDVDLPAEGDQTTHFSVIDAAGNCVVVTYTIEYQYGSRIVAGQLGFLYNNQMGDFNPQPGRTDATGIIGTKPNRIAPGKRMLSSMTPTIILKNGEPFAVLGSPGGRTIINTVLQVSLNLMEFEMSLPDAIKAGRIHHQWLPDEIRCEETRISAETRAALEKLGHRIKPVGFQGCVHAIVIDPKDKTRIACPDPRDADAAAAAQ